MEMCKTYTNFLLPYYINKNKRKKQQKTVESLVELFIFFVERKWKIFITFKRGKFLNFIKNKKI